MAAHTAVQLMLFAADFPAKTSQSQGRAKDSKARARRCGSKCFAWSVKLNPPSPSLRTRQCSVHGDSTWSSQDLPTSGLMRRGTLSPHPTVERPIFASGCGYLLPTPRASKVTDENLDSWLARRNAGKVATPPLALAARLLPTPTAQDAKNCENPSQARRHCPPLTSIVSGLGEYIPTPTVKGNYNRKGLSQKSGDGLATFVAKYPTPLARCAISPSNNPNRQGSLDLQTTVGGKLNPRWVEWLMGWPIGWASFEPSETDKFQSWLQLHSASSTLDS